MTLYIMQHGLDEGGPSQDENDEILNMKDEEEEEYKCVCNKCKPTEEGNLKPTNNSSQDVLEKMNRIAMSIDDVLAEYSSNCNFSSRQDMKNLLLLINMKLRVMDFIKANEKITD